MIMFLMKMLLKILCLPIYLLFLFLIFMFNVVSQIAAVVFGFFCFLLVLGTLILAVQHLWSGVIAFLIVGFVGFIGAMLVGLLNELLLAASGKMSRMMAS